MRFLALVLLVFAPAWVLAQDVPSLQGPLASATPQAHPPFVVANTELHTLHSEITGRNYLLYIGYPPSYGSDPARKYPVVYLSDGYWGFDRVYAQCTTGLWWDGVVPEFILVGIGYADPKTDYGTARLYELTPKGQTWGLVADYKGPQGGAREFLGAIKNEIIPYVENNTPADPGFRVIAGASLGGLFSLYSMYEEPGLFQGTIAASPTVPWCHCWLFQRESELREQALGDDLEGRLSVPTRLFMSVGGEETRSFVGYIKAFDNIIESAGYEDFTCEFRVIDGERHAGSVAEAINRGLRFVFKPQMPWPDVQ